MGDWLTVPQGVWEGDAVTQALPEDEPLGEGWKVELGTGVPDGEALAEAQWLGVPE